MKNITLALFILFTTPIFAQELSIDDLWKNVNNVEELKQSKLAISLATLNAKAENGRRLPLIYVDGNLQRNLIAPTTPVPAIAFNQNAMPGEIIPLKFATDWSSRAGINLSLNLFNPQTAAAINLANFEEKAKEIDAIKTVKDWKKNATEAYAKVVLSTLQFQQAIQDTVYYSEVLNILNTRFKAGRITALELNKAKQTLLDKRSQYLESYKVLNTSNAELSNYISLVNYTALSTSIEHIIEKIKPENQQIELAKLDLNQKRINAQLNDLKKEALPTLTLNSYYGSQFFSNNVSIWDTKYWNGNAYVNIALRIPISEAADRKIKRQKFNLEKEIVESQYRQQLTIDSIKLKTNNDNIALAKQTMQNAQAIEKIAAINVNIVKAKFDEGKVLIDELNSEINNHFIRKQENWQATYNYLLALLDQ